MKESAVYEKWHQHNRPWLEKCRNKHVAVTFSAGKDSSVCQFFLNEVKDEYGFELGAYMCAYPRHRYTDEINLRLRDYWESRDVKLVVQLPEETDEAMENQDNPCRPCQNIRKKSLPEIFQIIGKPLSDVVIVSGHSLWDIAAYSLNRTLANQLAVAGNGNETNSEDRLLEVSQRFYPFFTMPEGFSVFRPMLYLNQPEIHNFCLENSIPVIEEECRYSDWRPKNSLAEFFERFNYEFDYDTVFSYAIKNLGIIDLDRITAIDREEYLSRHF